MKISAALSRMLKAIVGAFSAAFAAFITQASTGNHHITSGGWIAVAAAFVLALGAVYVTPNSPAANVVTAIDSRLSTVEDQLPNIPGISKAVSDGVVTGLQVLGHVLQPVVNNLHVENAKPDPVPVESGDTLLASVADVPPVVQ